MLNQVLLRFEDDERTQAILAAVQSEGEAWMSPTTWDGRFTIRISVVGWRTSERDVEPHASPRFARAARLSELGARPAGVPAARSASSLTTAGSASVVVSPSGRFSATSRSRRRMIFPERVFGSSGVKTMFAGFAIAPIFVRDVVAQLLEHLDRRPDRSP